MNEIKMEIQKVGKDCNLTIIGTDHVELSTWSHPTSGHYVSACFYAVDPKQVLAQFLAILKEEVAK